MKNEGKEKREQFKRKKEKRKKERKKEKKNEAKIKYSPSTIPTSIHAYYIGHNPPFNKT